MIRASRLLEILDTLGARTLCDPAMGLPTHLTYLKRHGIAVHGAESLEWLARVGEGIVVNDSEGIMEIMYGLMPPDLQKRFGYDPHQAATLTDAQIEYQEEKRQAAAQAAGN